MTQANDLTGLRFGRFTVIGRGESVPRGRKMAATWQCSCDCGSERTVRGEDLRSGNSQSCGCIRREKLRGRLLTHGRSHEAQYSVWVQMRQRCSNPNDDKFSEYGGRGITVCDRWQSFENFIADMGERPSSSHSLDRIENNGNYEPDNVRWAVPTVQARNRRSSIWVEYDGKRMVAADLARLMGISSKRLYKVMATRKLDPVSAAEYVRAHRRS